MTIITKEQIWLIATMFQIQYGDKTLFELFGCGNSEVNINDFKFKEHGKFLDLMCGDVDSAWFVLIPTDGYYFVVRNKNSDYSNIKFPLEKIIKMLNFEDKI